MPLGCTIRHDCTAQEGVQEWGKRAGGISENSTPVDHKDRMLLSFLDWLAYRMITRDIIMLRFFNWIIARKFYFCLLSALGTTENLK